MPIQVVGRMQSTVVPAGPTDIVRQEDPLTLRPMTPNLHNWIPFGSTGMFVGEGTNISGAPTTAWWRYIGISRGDSAGFITLLAMAINSTNQLFQKTCIGGTWSGWKEYVGQQAPLFVVQDIELTGTLYAAAATGVAVDALGRIFDQGYRVFSYHNPPQHRFIPVTIRVPSRDNNHIYGFGEVYPSDVLCNATAGPLQIAGVMRPARSLWRITSIIPTMQVQAAGTL